MLLLFSVPGIRCHERRKRCLKDYGWCYVNEYLSQHLLIIFDRTQFFKSCRYDYGFCSEANAYQDKSVWLRKSLFYVHMEWNTNKNYFAEIGNRRHHRLGRPSLVGGADLHLPKTGQQKKHPHCSTRTRSMGNISSDTWCFQECNGGAITGSLTQLCTGHVTTAPTEYIMQACSFYI